MQRVGIFYSTRTGATERVARLLRRQFEGARVDLREVRRSDPADVAGYDLVILGAPTWEAEKLPREWEEFVEGLGERELAGRRVALFGLGDARQYPTHYVDAMGALHDWVVASGAEVIGACPEIDMRCYRSGALRDGYYVGLPLDEVNQPELIYHRVRSWARQLAAELGSAEAVPVEA